MSPMDYRDYEPNNIVFYAIVKGSSRITSFHSSELNAWKEAKRFSRKSKVELKARGFKIYETKELQVLA